ncbi:hypothetical protein [Luteitalea sp.]|uniref:helix-turn-helix transcriptional regulator n=1 Tax=Luteitalea sp. TaxID=2004800 RepID=UPI0025C12409|nr:hypothetical protein [Luteitalea sp.]
MSAARFGADASLSSALTALAPSSEAAGASQSPAVAAAVPPHAPVPADVPGGRPSRRRVVRLEDLGETLTLEQLLSVLGMGRSTAKRRMQAGTFPIPALPRIGQQPYRFAAVRVRRYLERAEHGVVFSVRRAS